MKVLERTDQKIKFTVLPTDGKSNTANIMITEGKFEGVVYNYGVMDIKDSKDSDDGVLSFEYTVEEPKDFLDTITTEDKLELEQTVGDILVDIIEQYVMEKTNDHRNNDTK